MLYRGLSVVAFVAHASMAIVLLWVAPLQEGASSRPILMTGTVESMVGTSIRVIDPEGDLSNEKLRLEVEKLRADTGTPALLRSWLPVGTIAVGLIAAIIGVWQYLSNRKREVDVRLQDQFREDMGDLVDYLEAERGSSARVVASIGDLQAIVPMMPDPSAQSRHVTEFLLAAIVSDLDFDDPRQVRFEAVALATWPGYSDWLTTHQGDQKFVLYRYEQALRTMQSRYPEYVRTMRMDSATGAFKVKEFIPEKDYLTLLALLSGYAAHVGRLEADAREAALLRLDQITDNPALRAALFSSSI